MSRRRIRFNALARHLPISFNYYRGQYTIEFRIPIYKGISINYFYGDKEWHTGKHTIMIMEIHYPSHWHGWCCGKWKFYHTGIYIGRRESCEANV